MEILPSWPVPTTWLMSTPISRAKRRTEGAAGTVFPLSGPDFFGVVLVFSPVGVGVSSPDIFWFSESVFTEEGTPGEESWLNQW